MFYAYTEQTPQIEDTLVEHMLASHGSLVPFDNSEQKIDAQWLISSQQTGAWCLLDNGEYALYKRIQRIITDHNTQDMPLEDRVLLRHLLKCGLIGDETSSTTMYPSRPFSLIFILSNRCNLVCKYCYLAMLPLEQKKHLSLEIARRTIWKAFEQATNNLLIDFGEIAIDFSFVSKLIHYAESLQPQFPTKKLALAVQTNGTTLSTEVLDFLQAHNVFVGISLDGPQQLHDQMRILHSGYGSHARIENGLREIIRRKIPHIVLCTISSANVRSASRILNYFLESGVSHFAFKPVIRRGHAQTEWESLGISADDFCEFLQAIVDYAISNQTWDALDDRLVKFTFRLLRDRRGWSDRCPTPECGCGTNMLVVNPQGLLYPCPRYTSIQQDGHNLGDDFSQAIIRSRALVHSTQAVSECHNCVWWANCKGGCPISRTDNYAEVSKKDPFCDIYRFTYHLIIKRVLSNIRKEGNYAMSKLGQIHVVNTLL